MFGSVGMPEILIILAIVMIIFGHDKLPQLGNSVGKAIRNFKKAMIEPEKKPDVAAPAKTTDPKEE